MEIQELMEYLQHIADITTHDRIIINRGTFDNENRLENNNLGNDFKVIILPTSLNEYRFQIFDELRDGLGHFIDDHNTYSIRIKTEIDISLQE